LDANLLLTLDADTHTDASNPDPPARIFTLCLAKPKSAPTTVMLSAPVVAILLRTTPLATGLSMLTPRVPVPAAIPVLTHTDKLDRIPLLALTTIDDDDTHLLASTPDPPIRPRAE